MVDSNTSLATKDNTHLKYDNEGVHLDFKFDSKDQAIWATAQDIANLFEIDVSTARKHIQNIYADEELEENRTSAKFALVQKGIRISWLIDLEWY